MADSYLPLVANPFDAQLRRGPPLCSTRSCDEDALLRCSACGVSRYCSVACQAACRRAHAPLCKLAKALTASIDFARTLNIPVQGKGTPADAFEKLLELQASEAIVLAEEEVGPGSRAAMLAYASAFVPLLDSDEGAAPPPFKNPAKQQELLYTLVNQAMELGSTRAVAAVADCLAFGRGCAPQPAEARALLERHQQRSPSARARLGLLCELGVGGPREPARARELYLAAARAHCGFAVDRLRRMMAADDDADMSMRAFLRCAGAHLYEPRSFEELARTVEECAGAASMAPLRTIAACMGCVDSMLMLARRASSKAVARRWLGRAAVFSCTPDDRSATDLAAVELHAAAAPALTHAEVAGLLERVIAGGSTPGALDALCIQGISLFCGQRTFPVDEERGLALLRQAQAAGSAVGTVCLAACLLLRLFRSQLSASHWQAYVDTFGRLRGVVDSPACELRGRDGARKLLRIFNACCGSLAPADPAARQAALQQERPTAPPYCDALLDAVAAAAVAWQPPAGVAQMLAVFRSAVASSSAAAEGGELEGSEAEAPPLAAGSGAGAMPPADARAAAKQPALPARGGRGAAATAAAATQQPPGVRAQLLAAVEQHRAAASVEDRARSRQACSAAVARLLAAVALSP